jgi:hypothetical protein
MTARPGVREFESPGARQADPWFGVPKSFGYHENETLLRVESR